MRWIITSASDEPDVKVLKLSIKLNKQIFTQEKRFSIQNNDINHYPKIAEVSAAITSLLVDVINNYLTDKNIQNDCKDIVHVLTGEVYKQEGNQYPLTPQSEGCQNITPALFDSLNNAEHEPLVITNILGFDRETAYHMVLESLNKQRDTINRLQVEIKQLKENSTEI